MALVGQFSEFPTSDMHGRFTSTLFRRVGHGGMRVGLSAVLR